MKYTNREDQGELLALPHTLLQVGAKADRGTDFPRVLRQAEVEPRHSVSEVGPQLRLDLCNRNRNGTDDLVSII